MRKPKSTHRDVVVVGASAGGFEQLTRLMAGLPADLPAAVCVVLHVPPWADSQLPALLTRAGTLPARHPIHLEALQHGHVYVAPPDCHFTIDSGRAFLWRGPKENQHRPAINALFRSAAVAYGPRLIGVVLSGTMEDGAAGLWWIKQYGGTAVVQDPRDALYPSMPATALQTVQADYVVQGHDLPQLLTRLIVAPEAASAEAEPGR